MARIGRLAGAILAESEEQFYLVGDLKEPCDFAKAGFESPGEFDAKTQPYRRLTSLGAGPIKPPYLTMELEGEDLARLLASCFVIKRNGSVSERLWRLVTDAGAKEVVNARWLAEMPPAIWQILQDAVLRCS